MDLFAYVVLGLAGTLLLAWGVWTVVSLWREGGLGQAIIMGWLALIFAACVAVSVIWLIGTKLI